MKIHNERGKFDKLSLWMKDKLRWARRTMPSIISAFVEAFIDGINLFTGYKESPCFAIQYFFFEITYFTETSYIKLKLFSKFYLNDRQWLFNLKKKTELKINKSSKKW